MMMDPKENEIRHSKRPMSIFSPLIAFLVGVGSYAPALGVKVGGVLLSLPFIFVLDYRFFLSLIVKGISTDDRTPKVFMGLAFFALALTLSLFGLFQDRVWLKLGGVFALLMYLTYAFSSPALIRGMKCGLILTVTVAGVQFFYFIMTKSPFHLPHLGIIQIATSTGNLLSAWSDVGLPIRVAGLAGEPGFLSSLLCLSILFFRTRFMLCVIAAGVFFSLSKVTIVLVPLLAIFYLATIVPWSRGVALLIFWLFLAALSLLSITIYLHVRELDPQFNVSWVDRTYAFYTYFVEYDLRQKIFGSGIYSFAQRVVPHVCSDFMNLGTYATFQECILYPHTWLGSLLIETGLVGLALISLFIYFYGNSRESIRGIFFFLICFMNVFYLTTYPIFSAVVAYILRNGKIGRYGFYSKQREESSRSATVL